MTDAKYGDRTPDPRTLTTSDRPLLWTELDSGVRKRNASIPVIDGLLVLEAGDRIRVTALGVSKAKIRADIADLEGYIAACELAMLP